MIAAIGAAGAPDKCLPIAQALIQSFRRSKAFMLPPGVFDRLGLAARAISRRQAENALVSGYGQNDPELFDELLAVDPMLRQSRLGWLRNRPEAPGGQNLLKLIERLDFLRKIGVDASRQDRIHPERWKQLAREGEITPSWLAADFNATRRRATIIAQLIELEAVITDASVAMFTKLMGRLFSRVIAERKQRHADNRKEMSAALRLFRDTLRALVAANEEGEDAFDVLDREIGWHRLVQAKPTIEAMVDDANPDPLLSAAEKYRSVREYAAQFLNAFVFRSNRTQDPLLAAVTLLKTLYREGRRSLPEKVPVGHLTDHVRRLVRADSKNERRLYEIATLSVLRDKLRSGDIWVEGSRTFRPIQDHLMPRVEFVSAKDDQTLGLGVPQNAEAFLTEAMQTIDFRLKRLAFRTRAGKLSGVRLTDGELIVTPFRSEVPPEVDDLKWELHNLLPQVHITSLLMEENSWIRFTDRFTHVRTQDVVKNDAAILAALLADASNTRNTAVSRERSFTATCPIDTDISACCPSVRRKAKHPMFLTGCSTMNPFGD